VSKANKRYIYIVYDVHITIIMVDTRGKGV